MIDLKIFYFTATGNCLAVAKNLAEQLDPESELLSIPQVLKSRQINFEDDVIGLIFPVYWYQLPKIIQRFLSIVKIKADYLFAICTYGWGPLDAMSVCAKYAAKFDIKFDYLDSLKMVDNYLPQFDMETEAARIPSKHIEENFMRICENVRLKHQNSTRVKLALNLYNFDPANYARENFLINRRCNGCKTCERVCPVGNIKVMNIPSFGSKCEGCLACIQNCPRNAIHDRSEVSAARWKHPAVTLKEIIESNCQID